MTNGFTTQTRRYFAFPSVGAAHQLDNSTPCVLMQPFEAVVVTDVVTDREKFNIDFLVQIFSWLPYMYRNS